MRIRGLSALVVAGISLAAQVAAAQTGSFYRVNIRAPDGRFFAAEWGGERELIADRAAAGPWEEFVLQDMTGGELLSGDTVRLRAQNGKYVSSDEGLVADRLSPGQWETFLIFKANWQSGQIRTDDYFYLVDYQGSYVNIWGDGEVGYSMWASASTTLRIILRNRLVTDPSPLDPAWVNAGTPGYSVVTLRASTNQTVVYDTWHHIVANGVSAGVLERFVLIDTSGGALVAGDIVRLRARDASWVLAVSGHVTAAYNKGKQRVFRIYKSNGGGGVINSGELVSLHAYDGRWWVAEGGGGGNVNANRTSIGPWEKFTLQTISTHASDPSPLGGP